LIPKRLELLRQIAPAAVSGGLLVNRSNPTAGTEIKQAEIAAGVLGLRLSIVNASVPGEIDKSITELVNQRVGGFATTSDILFSAQSAELAALAGRNLLPAVYHEPDITYAGGLLSYGSNIADAYRLAAIIHDVTLFLDVC
jgi:putative tryptophan/tyrosine transport system substrate-binding protein